MLYQINHDAAPRKLWCGPGAIALVTGRPTSEIYAHADAIAGHPVKGMLFSEFFDTLKKCGYRQTLVWQVLGNGRMTLRQWAQANRHLTRGRPIVVHVGNHYGVVAGRRYVDNQTRDPVPLSESKYLRSYVRHAWSVERVGAATPAPISAPRKPANKDGTRARYLAKKHGIEIEKLEADSWCVTCPALAEDDPHEGDHFADGPSQVLAMVEDYVKCLTAGYLDAVTAPATTN